MMRLSNRGERGARKWRSGGDAGAFACPSQPSTTLWPSFSGRPSSSGDARQRSIARRSSTRSAHCPPIRLCPTATLATRFSLACAHSMSHGTNVVGDMSSFNVLPASVRSTSSAFCTSRWTSAGTFPTNRRLADPNESVERLTYHFDAHLTPNVPNFAEFGRRKCHVGSSHKSKNEFKMTSGGLVRLA